LKKVKLAAKHYHNILVTLGTVDLSPLSTESTRQSQICKPTPAWDQSLALIHGTSLVKARKN